MNSEFPDKYRLDKSAILVGKLKEQPDDIEYWKTKSYEERMEALSFLRIQSMSDEDRKSGLQRVINVIRQK